MEKSDYIILSLFFVIVICLTITLFKINDFMPSYESCKDDFKVFERCNCISCNWEDAEKYNGKGSCEEFRP